MAQDTPAQERPLLGQVAVVAGATRGAGRGIARALGEAGAFVYCTGRSVPGNPSPYGRRETIDETAAMIVAAGGQAVAVRVDHTVESEVEALFKRIDAEHARRVAGADALSDADARDYILRFLPAYRLYVPPLRAHPPAPALHILLGRDRNPVGG